VTVAIAAGVGIGALATGSAWSSRRRGLAAWLVLAILAGEAFGFISTAERLVASREAAQAPFRDAAQARAKAERRVADANADLANAPKTSPRLAAAIAEKGKADQAAAEKAAERGCRENCRQILQARIDAAGVEIAAARAALADIEGTRRAELAAARSALAVLRAAPSATPLADRLGLPSWALDLIAAALGSIAANGLACGLIAFAGHKKSPRDVGKIERSAAQLEPSPATRVDEPTNECVQRFAFERLFPARADAGADLLAIKAEFQRWCAQRQITAPAGAELAQALSDLFEGVGIPIQQRGERFMAMGVMLRGDQVALPAHSQGLCRSLRTLPTRT
jgi:hypothetical protein